MPFDPNEQRDDHGRWAGAAVSGAAGAAIGAVGAAKAIQWRRRSDNGQMRAAAATVAQAKATNHARAGRIERVRAKMHRTLSAGPAPKTTERFLRQAVTTSGSQLRRATNEVRDHIRENGMSMVLPDGSEERMIPTEDDDYGALLNQNREGLRQRIQDLREKGRPSRIEHRPEQVHEQVAGYEREHRGPPEPVWEATAGAKLAHLRHRLGLDDTEAPPPPPPAAGHNGAPALDDLPQSDAGAGPDWQRQVDAGWQQLTADERARLAGRPLREQQLSIARKLNITIPAGAMPAPRRAPGRRAMANAMTEYRRLVDLHLAQGPEHAAALLRTVNAHGTLDAIERHVRNMPAAERNQFLEAHALPTLRYVRPVRTVQVPPVEMRIIPAHDHPVDANPGKQQRRALSQELRADVDRRAQDWLLLDDPLASARVGAARQAAAGLAPRALRARFMALRKPKVRLSLIGAGAALGAGLGLGGYFGARALLHDTAEKLAKAADEVRRTGGGASPSPARPQSALRQSPPSPDEQPRGDVAQLDDAPRFTMLIGMPGSGKTTWRQHRMAQGIVRPTTVISTDDQVEDVARRFGIGFSAAYQRTDMKAVEREQDAAMQDAFARGHDVIVDRISASPKRRAKALRKVPAHYEKHAVVFDVPEDELVRRRALRPGKVIPAGKLAEMQAAWQLPRPGEFDHVHTVGSNDALSKAASDDESISGTTNEAAKSDTPSLSDAADKAHAALSRRLATMFGAWKASVEDQMLNPGSTTIHQAMTADLAHALTPLDAAAQAGADQPIPVGKPGAQIAVTMLGRTPQVQSFVDQYREDRIVDLADEQRDAIKDQLIDAAKTGASPQEMARRVKELVGLAPSQMASVVNYRAELEALSPKALTRKLRDRRFDGPITRAIDGGKPLSADDVNRFVDAYSRRYLAYRANTIARTESVGAANNGHAAAVETYLGDKPGYQVEKTWVAHRDERTRPDHYALHGQKVVGMDTPFRCESGDVIRWPHDPRAPARQIINCRCTWTTRLIPTASDLPPEQEENDD